LAGKPGLEIDIWGKKKRAQGKKRKIRRQVPWGSIPHQRLKKNNIFRGGGKEERMPKVKTRGESGGAGRGGCERTKEGSSKRFGPDGISRQKGDMGSSTSRRKPFVYLLFEEGS